jgi:hypothetical protein
MPGLYTNGASVLPINQIQGSMEIPVDTEFSNGASPQTAAITVDQLSVGSFGIVAAAGASQGTATLLASMANIVTVTASTEGVKLPLAATGLMRRVFVPGTVGVKVYPNTGDKISTAATNAAVLLVADKANIYLAKDDKTWAVQKGA